MFDALLMIFAEFFTQLNSPIKLTKYPCGCSFYQALADLGEHKARHSQIYFTDFVTTPCANKNNKDNKETNE